MSQAITPTRAALLQMARQLKGSEEADAKKGIDYKDAHLHELKSMPGWKDLSGFIDRQAKALRPVYDFEGDNDDDFFKSYGMRSVVYDIVRTFADSIIAKVEDTYEEVEKRRQK